MGVTTRCWDRRQPWHRAQVRSGGLAIAAGHRRRGRRVGGWSLAGTRMRWPGRRSTPSRSFRRRNASTVRRGSRVGAAARAIDHSVSPSWTITVAAGEPAGAADVAMVAMVPAARPARKLNVTSAATTTRRRHRPRWVSRTPLARAPATVVRLMALGTRRRLGLGTPRGRTEAAVRRSDGRPAVGMLRRAGAGAVRRRALCGGADARAWSCRCRAAVDIVNSRESFIERVFEPWTLYRGPPTRTRHVRTHV